MACMAGPHCDPVNLVGLAELCGIRSISRKAVPHLSEHQPHKHPADAVKMQDGKKDSRYFYRYACIFSAINFFKRNFDMCTNMKLLFCYYSRHSQKLVALLLSTLRSALEAKKSAGGGQVSIHRVPAHCRRAAATTGEVLRNPQGSAVGSAKGADVHPLPEPGLQHAPTYSCGCRTGATQCLQTGWHAWVLVKERSRRTCSRRAAARPLGKGQAQVAEGGQGPFGGQTLPSRIPQDILPPPQAPAWRRAIQP